MISAYASLHRMGVAHSFEVWQGDGLVGGLYGIALGEVFFGESMYSHGADASKTALALLVELALRRQIRVIDCQVYTQHLASLGAREIERDTFEGLLRQHVNRPAAPIAPIAPFPAAELRSAS
jgi:leucyl/phenylalanyl-tRNA--protein transferase